MKPARQNNRQSLLFQPRLSDELDKKYELYILAKSLSWKYLEREFDGFFTEKIGAPAKPTRLVVGILMLQHMYNLSDNQVIKGWIENPYWQFFCGYDRAPRGAYLLAAESAAKEVLPAHLIPSFELMEVTT